MFLPFVLVIATVSQGEWPLSELYLRIWHSYGQYQEIGAQIPYFHRGIDIPAPVGTSVRSCTDGTVIDVDGQGYGTTIQILDANGITWEYSHLTAGSLIKNGRTIVQGEFLGRLAQSNKNIIPSHLHLNTIRGGQYDDPLLYLQARVKKADRPPKPSQVLYKDQARSKGKYESTTCSNLTVLANDVDVIVEAADGFLQPGVGGLAVHEIRFLVNDVSRKKIVINETAFTFGSNRKRNVPIPKFSLGSDLIPVVYERDLSIDRDAKRKPAFDRSVVHRFFYVVTNIGVDRKKITPKDQDRYWNTKISSRARDWNEVQPVATSNADAMFPDGVYRVLVNTRDENNLRSPFFREKVFINNFDELLVVVDSKGQESKEFAGNTPVFVMGKNHSPNRTFQVYVLPAGDRKECASLKNLVSAEVKSNAQGEIPATAISGTEELQGDFLLVLDYDNDQKLTGTREQHSVDTISKKISIE